MALVKIEDTLRRPAWGRDHSQNKKGLPDINEKPPTLDYEKLKWLNNLGGLKGREYPESTEDAHEVFMKSYHLMFVKPEKKVGFPIHAAKRLEQQKSTLSTVTHRATGKPTEADKKVHRKDYPVDNITYDIRDYLPLLHKQRKSEHPEAIYRSNMRTLRKLLKKLPFERTASDNDKMFSILRTFDFFRDKFPPAVLKELCVVAVCEQWKEAGFSVFGNVGVYMVLRGTVSPMSHPYLQDMDNVNEVGQPGSPKSRKTESDGALILGHGEVFGTLKKHEKDANGNKPFSVITNEPCEFMKISAADYSRIIDQIKQREHTEKVNLLLSCGQYKLWPRQPLLQVAELIEWMSFPPNTIIASEGYKAPYIAFIKSGECHVLRQVDVMTEKNGKREKRTKQVVMGKLNDSESFAELSILLDEPITCSIVSATNVQLGVIKPERIEELDEVTIQLFQQSNVRTFGDLSKENIQDEYMHQELKREWNEFKHSVVVDVINYRGIRPGYGKWSK